jgi:hypothetical protein
VESSWLPQGARRSVKKWLPGREGKGKNEPLSKISHISTNKIQIRNFFWILVVEMVINLFIKLVFAFASPLFRKAMSKYSPFLTKFKNPNFNS